MKTTLKFLSNAILAALMLVSTHSVAQSGSTYRFEQKYASKPEQAPAEQPLADPAKSTPGNKSAKPAPVSAKDTVPIALIAISTDLSRSTAGGGEEQSRISNGKLGISFVTKYFYGDLSFTAVANGRESAASNVGDTAFFYNTLLLAQNRSAGFNELSGSIGVNKLLPAMGILKDSKDSTELENRTNLFYWWANSFGLYVNHRSSNQTWVKDSLTSTDLLLSATSILATLQLFNFRIKSLEWGHLQIVAFGGWTTRRLGGNYALADTPRKMFLGTDKTVFNGWEYGVKMELGPFYGRASFTEFNLDDNIPGFSGPQLSVSLGAVVNLNFEAYK